VDQVRAIALYRTGDEFDAGGRLESFQLLGVKCDPSQVGVAMGMASHQENNAVFVCGRSWRGAKKEAQKEKDPHK
jgi:hypothetical protein